MITNIIQLTMDSSVIEELCEDKLYQYDYGIYLKIMGLPTTIGTQTVSPTNITLHITSVNNLFGNSNFDSAFVCSYIDGTIETGIRFLIPNECLQYAGTLFVYVTYISGDIIKTIHVFKLRIIGRPKPGDYAPPVLENTLIERARQLISEAGLIGSYGYSSLAALGITENSNLLQIYEAIPDNSVFELTLRNPNYSGSDSGSRWESDPPENYITPANIILPNVYSEEECDIMLNAIPYYFLRIEKLNSYVGKINLTAAHFNNSEMLDFGKAIEWHCPIATLQNIPKGTFYESHPAKYLYEKTLSDTVLLYSGNPTLNSYAANVNVIDISDRTVDGLYDFKYLSGRVYLGGTNVKSYYSFFVDIRDMYWDCNVDFVQTAASLTGQYTKLLLPTGLTSSPYLVLFASNGGKQLKLWLSNVALGPSITGASERQTVGLRLYGLKDYTKQNGTG